MTWIIWGYPHFRKPPYQAALLSLTSTSRSMFRMKDIFPKTNRNKILLSTTRSFGTLQQCPSWKVFCIQFPKISWKHGQNEPKQVLIGSATDIYFSVMKTNQRDLPEGLAWALYTSVWSKIVR